MKFTKIICVVTLAAVLLAGIGLVNAPATSVSAEDTVTINGIQYVKTFEDEFNGTSLDKTKWEYCPEWSRQGGYCYWENDMTSLDGDGHLLLNADYDAGGTLRCGAVRTRDLFDQKFGYFEISVKLQSKPGFWSAFWMMPYSIDSGVKGGSDGTELDIYEAFDTLNGRINTAIHYDGYGSNHQSIGRAHITDTYDGKFHTFSLDWAKDAYTFYIDGTEIYKLTSEDCDISRVKSYLKISLESGSWTGLPNESDMPDGIVVDYVKAYQRAEYLQKPTTTTTTTVAPTTQPTTVNEIMYGDVNGDKNVNMADLLVLKKYTVGIVKTIEYVNTDVNFDKMYDLKDMLMIKKHIVKIQLAPWD